MDAVSFNEHVDQLGEIRRGPSPDFVAGGRMHADERPIQVLEQLETSRQRLFRRQIGNQIRPRLTFRRYRIDEIHKIVAEMSSLGHPGKVSLPFHGNVEPRELCALLETGEIASSGILQNRPCIPVSAKVDRHVKSIRLKALLQPPEIVITQHFVSREGSRLKKIERDELVDL